MHKPLAHRQLVEASAPGETTDAYHARAQSPSSICNQQPPQPRPVFLSNAHKPHPQPCPSFPSHIPLPSPESFPETHVCAKRCHKVGLAVRGLGAEQDCRSCAQAGLQLHRSFLHGLCVDVLQLRHQHLAALGGGRHGLGNQGLCGKVWRWCGQDVGKEPLKNPCSSSRAGDALHG